jgi:hypothetical protein
MGKHILFWVIVIAVMTLALPIIVTPEQMVGKVKSEIGYITNAFGEDESKKLIDSANSFYNEAFVQSGVIKTAGYLYVNDEESKSNQAPGIGQTASNFNKLTNSYLLSMSANVYAMTIRVGILLAWLPYLFPFILATIVHGLVRRKIKMWTFGFVSPSIYGTSMHALVVISFIPVLYLLSPIAITPLFIPFWAILSALPIGLLVANIQRIK